MTRSVLFAVLALMFLSLPVSAQNDSVTVVITKDYTPTVTVAVISLDRGVGSEDDPKIPESVAEILRYDLDFSDYFKFVTNRSWIAEAHDKDKQQGTVNYAEWKRLGANAIIKGVYKKEGKNISLDLLHLDVDSQTLVLGKNYTFPASELRRVVHMFSDQIIRKYIGQPGAGVAESKIAFVNSKGGVKEVYMMDYDGFPESVKRLTYDNNIALFPTWSPNGSQLAFMSYKNGNPDLYVLNFGSGLIRHLLGQPGINTTPAWHPSSKSLSVALSKDGNAEIYSVDSSGGSLKRLTKNPAGDCSPAWSPSGNEIAFTSDRNGMPHIYVMSADGSNVRRLTSGAWQDDNANWSPDGKWIAFCTSAGRNFDICLVDPLGQKMVNLTHGEGSNEGPCWAPDSQHIVFSSTRDGACQAYVMDVDGQDVRRLTYLPGDNQTPYWSPNPSQ